MLILLACGYKETPEDTSVLDTIEDTDTDTTDTGDPIPEDLGDPYLALVGAVPPGILQSTCAAELTVYEDDVLFTTISQSVLGGEWFGVDLSGDATYTATAAYSACSELDPDGDVLESGRFSGVAGFLFVFWLNGSNAGYASLEQTVDFNGGKATIELEPGSDPAGIQAIADGMGVVLTLSEPDTYDAVFPTDLPVGAVLSALSADPAFREGSPQWIDAPSWW